MADPQPTNGSNAQQIVVVPADTRAAQPELVELILHSESMNDDERRYWIDILPAMNPEQVGKLKDILVRERDQLAAIDAKYATDMSRAADAQALRHMGDERHKKLSERASTESDARATEALDAQKLLDQMDKV